MCRSAGVSPGRRRATRRVSSAWLRMEKRCSAWLCVGCTVPLGKVVIVLVPTGNPPSLRFGHPDVTFGRYRLSSLGYCAGAAAFSGCALRVSARTLSVAKRGGAERPGDGCPCVGAEEICGAPPLLSEGRNEGEHRGNHDGGSAGCARHGLDLLIHRAARWVVCSDSAHLGTQPCCGGYV